MKFLLILNKAWNHDGKDFAAGTTIELTDKALAAGLVLDGIASRVEQSDVDVTEKVNKAVEQKFAAAKEQIVTDAAAKIHDIQVKDLSDADGFHGFLPGYNGGKTTTAQKQFAAGLFAKDLFEAGERCAKPSERLAKSRERSAMMIQKAAGDGLTVAADNSAGVLVPPEISMAMFGVADEVAVIDPLCAHMSIASNRIEFPKVSDYDRSAGLVYGGALAYWKGEDALLTSSKPVTEEIAVNLHALTALAYASDQSLKFAGVDLGAYLLNALGAAITYKRESVFVTGTGVGMPLGIMNAPCAIQVAKESNQTAATIVLKNVYKMEAALKVQNAASVAWIYNRIASLSDLRSLALVVGTSGSAVPAFVGNPLSNAATLDGIRILHSEHCKTIGQVGDIALVDWSQYLVVDHRSGVDVANSIHLKFDYSQVAYKAMCYVGGQPLASKSYTDTNSKSSSPVVLLAIRS